MELTSLCRDWSGRQDSNLRPHGPKPCALPGCATPRVPPVSYKKQPQVPNSTGEKPHGQVKQPYYRVKIELFFQLPSNDDLFVV